jgi:hypothetical protein
MTRSLFILLCILVCGCGNTRTTSQDGYQVKEVTKETPTQDGGRIIEKTITHQGQSDSTTKTTPDDATNALIGSVAPILGSAFGAATGTAGLPWGEILGGAATLAVTGWAALKHGQTGELKRQVDFHKADADDAYAKLNSKE